MTSETGLELAPQTPATSPVDPSSPVPVPEHSERSLYTSGLRQLADLLDANPDIPLPYDGHLSPLSWILVSDAGQKSICAAITRALPGKVEKSFRDDRLDLTAKIAGLKVQVIASREQVCERRVIGTREVTKTVPDPTIVVPQVEVTQTEEIVEWICSPLLKGEGAAL